VAPDRETDLIGQAWSAVSGDPARPAGLDVRGGTGHLASRFAASETAVACVGAALLAAAALHQQRGGAVNGLTLDRAHVATAFLSERYFRAGDEPAGAGFAPLSRFWPAADGWVRTHANYPWHRDALFAALEVPSDAGADAVAERIAELAAREVEGRVFAAGGVTAAVRPFSDWRDTDQGGAVGSEPLVAHRSHGGAPPRTRPAAGLPASGVRVLDLTRVIAGPVCTRYLGALGADVVRLDPPRRPDMARGAAGDTLLGKRSALVDLASPAGGDVARRLLDGADVVVCGYRPGALEQFGLGEPALAERHPGLVVVYLDAWGHTGPWAGRRGFDSVVQAAAGIATGESSDGAAPGALPCQLLDHGTGYLAAAAVLDGLVRQGREGGTHIRRVSLARTAWWLTSAAAPASPAAGAPAGGSDPAQWLCHLDGPVGTVTAVSPPGSVDDQPLQWPGRASGYCADRPEWATG
jgi:crotonobetainyl-CoA:carnitine CoA-transferase CaiB-like acyl-CoA transferase